MATKQPIASTNRLSPLVALLLLSVVFALACPLFAWIGYERHGTAGISAALVAGGICWIAGVCALGVISYLCPPLQAVNAVGVSMLVRMAIPLAAGFFLTTSGGPLAEAGVFGMIVGFYLIGLLVETILAVRLVADTKQQQASKSA